MLGAQRGVAGQLGLQGGTLGRRQLAQQVGDEALGAIVGHRASSIRVRSRFSPLTIRIFTVPSGMPVSAAICDWLAPA